MPQPLVGAGVAGCYGKLPSMGDFITHNLPQSFVQPWDEWLQRSISTSKQRLGERWLDTYLQASIRRFALMPNICGPQAWAGVLMPSVDRVGRYFPLTIAAPLAPNGDLLTRFASAHTWYEAIDQLALGMLTPNSTLGALQDGLASLPFPDSEDQDRTLSEFAGWWLSAALKGSVFTEGRSFWWTHASESERSMRQSDDLPLESMLG